MSSFALQRGQGSAFGDLPPTLQPHVIAASAPRPDYLRNLGLSGLIYFLLGGAVILFSPVSPSVLPPSIRLTEPTRVVEIGDILRPPVTRHLPATLAGGGTGMQSEPSVTAPTPSADPVEVAAGLPTEDRRDQAPGGMGPVGSHPIINPASSGPGNSPAVQELGDSGLAVLRQVEPIYPEFARRAHIQGAVVLHMVVDESGQPIRVEVLDGHPVFHQVAVQAARQWRFEPARREGRPVSASFRLTLKFSLR